MESTNASVSRFRRAAGTRSASKLGVRLAGDGAGIRESSFRVRGGVVERELGLFFCFFWEAGGAEADR